MRKSTFILFVAIWLWIGWILKLMLHDIHGADIYAVGALIACSIHAAYTDLKK